MYVRLQRPERSGAGLSFLVYLPATYSVGIPDQETAGISDEMKEIAKEMTLVGEDQTCTVLLDAIPSGKTA